MVGMEDARRRIIDSAVSNICLSVGFESAESSAVETLSEMMVNYLCEILLQTKLYAELQAHTEPTLHDVGSTLIEFGVDLKSFFKYIKQAENQQFVPIAEPMILTVPKPPPVLHVIKPRPHFNYIHDHFPPFPDAHTYVSTQCAVKNDRDYLKTREMLAEQKINTEKNLVRIKLKYELLKHGSKELSIFNEETTDTTFMLVKNESNKPELAPYLKGLLIN